MNIELALRANQSSGDGSEAAGRVGVDHKSALVHSPSDPLVEIAIGAGGHDVPSDVSRGQVSGLKRSGGIGRVASTS